MPIEITMPRLSDTMEEGTLVKWHVSIGDKIASGDTLADVETDKATMELQAFDDGTVAKLAVEEGQTLPVGGLILVLAEEGEDVEQAAQAGKSAGGSPAKAAKKKESGAGADDEEPAEEEPAEETGEEAGKETDKKADKEAEPASAAATSGGAARVKASPLARKMAQEHGLDLAGIKGSGPGGRIIKRDILAAQQSPRKAGAAKPASATASKAASAPAAPAAQLEARTIPVGNMRKTIARRLVESKTTIPHFTITVAVDMDPLLAAREALNQQFAEGRGKLSVTDLLTRAVALAITRHPMINTSWTDQGIAQHGSVNMGIAVSLPAEKGGGLVVPVIRDAQNKSLWELAQQTKFLADKARTTGLTIEEMSNGTFTISNLGMFGVEHFEAIINPPQAAILAVGATIEKPVVRHGQIVVGREMTLTLSADHRVVDGSVAAEFLATLKTIIQSPITLLA